MEIYKILLFFLKYNTLRNTLNGEADENNINNKVLAYLFIKYIILWKKDLHWLGLVLSDTSNSPFQLLNV